MQACPLLAELKDRKREAQITYIDYERAEVQIEATYVSKLEDQYDYLTNNEDFIRILNFALNFFYFKNEARQGLDLKDEEEIPLLRLICTPSLIIAAGKVLSYFENPIENFENLDRLKNLFIKRFWEACPHLQANKEIFDSALQFIAYCLAIKVSFDGTPMDNILLLDALKASGTLSITQKAMNKMEILFLEAIKSDISIDLSIIL